MASLADAEFTLTSSGVRVAKVFSFCSTPEDGRGPMSSEPLRMHEGSMVSAWQLLSSISRKRRRSFPSRILHNAQPVDQGPPVHEVPEHTRSTFSRFPCILCQVLHTTWSHTFSCKWLRRPELPCNGVWDARLQQQTDKVCTRVMHSKYQHTRMLGCSSRLDKVCTRVKHSKYQHARSTFSRLPCVLCQGFYTTWSHTFSRKWLRRPRQSLHTSDAQQISARKDARLQ